MALIFGHFKFLPLARSLAQEIGDRFQMFVPEPVHASSLAAAFLRFASAAVFGGTRSRSGFIP
jgi:hypothetical protein